MLLRKRAKLTTPEPSSNTAAIRLNPLTLMGPPVPASAVAEAVGLAVAVAVGLAVAVAVGLTVAVAVAVGLAVAVVVGLAVAVAVAVAVEVAVMALPPGNSSQAMPSLSASNP